jgi:histidyl-tRNA synthetase
MKLNKESYKGVRDFYPEEMAQQKYIFDKWRKTAEAFGYEEMDASLLEPTELYEAKTGEEIVNEQTYTFKDRGDRKVTIRPEMTPTVARMVAKKKRELTLPVRWYSISNFFRYERPQKGRLREFWQINCDIFGISGVNADTESVSLAYAMMKEFGVKDSDFEIRVNNRKLVEYILKEKLSLNDKESYKLSKLIDKKDRMSDTEFKEQAKVLLGDKTKDFVEMLNVEDLKELNDLSENEGYQEIEDLFKELDKLGIKNYKFDSTLIRGLDYYTGLVFEIFDANKKSRSILGGGRYDNLLEIFGEDALPTVGFAVGDITMMGFLKDYDLLPEYSPKAQLFICTLDEEYISQAAEMAQKLRGEGINVLVNLGKKKIGDQISLADKKGIPYILCIGDKELKSGKFKVKNLKTKEEKNLSLDKIAKFLT